MFFRILKKDLKRKKTMNIILLMFIMIATMFVSSGINNLITVLNGTDYYLDKAGIGDYIVITMGDNAVGNIEEVLSNEKTVENYKIETVVYGTKDNVTLGDGAESESKNATIFQSIDDAKITFFNMDNEKITKVEPGHVYVSGDFMKVNNLKVGDKINIEYGNVTMSLVLSGKAKDALLGSSFMGNTRFIMNDGDFEVFLKDEEIRTHAQGEIGYIEAENIEELSLAISKVPGVAFNSGRSTLKLCYVMDMIVAFIVLILSICLMVVSFIVLKFSIGFTMEEEFREIGVMKAIGIGNRKIRGIYIVKYLGLAVVGATIGLVVSIPFGNMLLQSVSENMVLGHNGGVLANIFGFVLVILSTVLCAYRCTKKVKKSSCIDAIRMGQTGERYKKKSFYRLRTSRTGTSFYMAINDILSSPKRFITIIATFLICTVFVLVLENTVATMNSSKLIYTFGSKSDLYIINASEIMEHMNAGNKLVLEEYFEEKEAELEEQNMPGEFICEVQYKYKLSFEGKEYMLTCQQGMGTSVSDYKYTEGVVPQLANEIAITPQIAEKTGAKIGDTVTIHYGDKKEECMITAYFQTMNQLGEVIRLHEDAPTDFENIATILSYQINFTDDPTAKEIEDRKEQLKKLYNNNDVMNTAEYCVNCVGVVDTLELVKYMLLAITLIVVILVTILMERTFVADEKSQIAILKAIGLKDSAIIKWHIYRFGIVTVIAILFAAILSVPMTELCITPIFSMMGAIDIDYSIRPLQVFIMYPGIVFLVTVIVAFITSLYTKTITSSDTANIE